jgi:hypothetical protein
MVIGMGTEIGIGSESLLLLSIGEFSEETVLEELEDREDVEDEDEADGEEDEEEVEFVGREEFKFKDSCLLRFREDMSC